MFLKRIKVSNFKNIRSFEFNFDKGINYFFSPNGTGKTNILESIQVLTIGKSLRSIAEKDVIPFDNNDQKSVIVDGTFSDENGIIFNQNYTIHLQPKFSKELKINGNKLSQNQYIGRVPSIWFGPESIKIINSSPFKKRKFFDDIMIQLYPSYHIALKSYNRALKQRNKLLQNEVFDKKQIGIWTEQLILYGSEVIQSRKNFFELLNHTLKQIKNILRYNFQIQFNPSIALDPIFNENIKYKFRSELQRNYNKDLNTRMTNAGPHKDNWDIFIQILPDKNWISAKRFASRGQQRMSLITLMVALIKIFEHVRNTRPIMLLDDIFSELDMQNVKTLLNFIKETNIQTFITGIEKLENKQINQINLCEFLND